VVARGAGVAKMCVALCVAVRVAVCVAVGVAVSVAVCVAVCVAEPTLGRWWLRVEQDFVVRDLARN